MERRKILIAEDDTDINHLLSRILTKDNYNTIQAFSGTEAKLLLKMEMPDLMILDLMLPGLTGEELIVAIRGGLKPELPILVLSAKAGLETKVQALKSGADDYLTKPFEAEELLARVEAILRRYKAEGKTEESTYSVYQYKQLELNPKSRKVTLNGKEIPLTLHEYDILSILIKDPDKVHSREALYELVWQGGYYGEDNTVNVHVSNLRKKLMAAEPGEEYIKTVWGIGFKMA